MRGHRILCVLGAVFVGLYLGATAWFTHPVLQSTRPGTFDGLVLAVPGFPWSFLLAWLDVPMSRGILGVTWLANACLFYWWGTVWTRWLSKDGSSWK